jgi:two-component system sensor histidine kinase SenX3
MALFARREARVQDVAPQAEMRDALQAMRLLREEADLVSAALDALPLAVIVVDANGVTRVRNAAATRLGGGAHGDVLLRAAVDQHATRARAGADSASTIELFGPPTRVLQVTATPLAGAGALITIDDISERARLDAVRTDFVANISHELKTPVGALAVLAEAMEGEDDQDVLRRLAAKASNEAHRAARVIDDLLELSRIELGGLAVSEPVAVSMILGDVLDRTRSAAETRDVEIHIDVPERSELTAIGDRRQLVSAISNLVENAIKYSEPGSDVWVTAGVTPDAGSLEFVVRDVGIGIPARDLDRIFERFYRVDRARSRDTGGTGLGLAIVRHVATNHHGEVTVSSVEGEGSTFTLRLPNP